jgi:ribosomal protein L14E/L6E/L27E
MKYWKNTVEPDGPEIVKGVQPRKISVTAWEGTHLSLSGGSGFTKASHFNHF